MATTGAATYDGFVRTSGDELWDRIGEAHRRFAALLSVTPGPTPIPGSDWTAGDASAHLLTVLRRYTRPDTAGAHAAEIEDLHGQPVSRNLDAIWQELHSLEEKLPRSADLHEPFPLHHAVTMDGAGALGNLIGEFVVHGWGVARGRGKQWRIGSRNAALALTAGMQASPAYVAPDAPGDLKLQIRTPQTRPWMLDYSDGVLTSRRAVRWETADVRIVGRTEPLLLNLYGRIGMARATAHGVTVLGGRRPWRIARVSRTFLTP
ncbi:MAG: hypothetical protein JWP74_1060 [Marmoricola sp.]|nr:hypothetical protein [Marmoricola sp.]